MRERVHTISTAEFRPGPLFCTDRAQLETAAPKHVCIGTAVAIGGCNGVGKDRFTVDFRWRNTSLCWVTLLSMILVHLSHALPAQLLKSYLSHGPATFMQCPCLVHTSLMVGVTVTQLIYLTNKWQMALEKGNHVQAAFLDLSKAYDRVSIPGLLYKLSALSWILNREPEVVFFLSSRLYTVCKSKWNSIICRVSEVGNPARHCIGPGPVLNIHKRLTFCCRK